MSARILIVDDMDINLRLMEARLSAEYFEVVAAKSGPEALEICRTMAIDLVLLDVMMPDMDGFEVCRRLKADASTRHLPIVLVTALDQSSDRVRGLEAGADDFLTKPVGDLQLFSRVKGLARLKRLSDEIRVRTETTMDVVSRTDLIDQLATRGTDGHLVVFDDEAASAARIARVLRAEHRVEIASDTAAILNVGDPSAIDLLVVNLSASSYDALRLCSQIRSGEALRRIPVLVIADPQDEVRTAKALELGANDYIVRPVDRNELLARVRSQIKRKRYDEGLRQSLQRTIELAVTDALTGLNNRRFLETHLPAAVDRARSDGKQLSVLIADIDHFKAINDRLGHAAGDEVLRQFATRVKDSIRVSDLACRYGGEEFVVMMPDADEKAAQVIAERLRMLVADAPFDICDQRLTVTVSVGFATLSYGSDDMAALIERADRGLYAAKGQGRNRVVMLAA